MSDGFAFLIDVPESVLLAAGQARSRVQVAKTGKFKDPRYGKFSITPQDFTRWIKNFAELSVVDGRAGLPIDVDHSPEKQGTTEAAGWVVSLDTKGKDGKSSTPGELWAVAEWNTLGQELIRDRRYLYLSPSYQHDYEDEQGKKHGTALVGIGMTNRPFLQMATVSLSTAFAVEETAETDPEPKPSDSRGSMILTAEVATALGLEEGEVDDAVVLAKVTELSKTPEPDEPTQKTLAQLAGEAGKIVLDAKDFASLTANATAGAAAATELHDQKFTTGWATALSEGRVTPAQEENFKALYEAAPDEALKTLAALPVAIHMTADGRGGGTGGGAGQALDAAHKRDAEGDEVDADAAELDRKAQALCAADKDLDYGEAILLAAAGG